MIKKTIYKISIISTISLVICLSAESQENIQELNQSSTESIGKTPWEQKKKRVDIDPQKIENFKQQKQFENNRESKEKTSPESFSQKLNNCEKENKTSETPSTIINKSEKYPEKLTNTEQAFISCLAD